MDTEGETQKMSFSIDVGGGKRLRLIDVSTEDDYLIASPLFDSLEDLRLSVTLENKIADENHYMSLPYETSAADGNSADLLQQQGKDKLLPSGSMEPGRPSYLRKSLAWDSAFFTNAGVLDPDELFLMNNGLKPRPLPRTREDVQWWRSESATPSVYDDGFKLEGIEGDPFEDVRASIHRSAMEKKVDIHSRMKCKPAAKGKSLDLQSTVKSKYELTAKNGEHHRLCLKPPKASGHVKGIPAGQSERLLMRKKYVPANKDDKFGRTRTGQSSMVCKKLSSSVSSIAVRNSTLPGFSFKSPLKSTSPDIASNQWKRKIESRKSQLSASVSSSRTPSRYSLTTKRQAHLSLSTKSLPISYHSSVKSPASSTGDRIWSSKRQTLCNLDPRTAPRKFPRSETFQALDSKYLHDQSSSFEERDICSPLPFNTHLFGSSPASSESAESAKRSGLRMPSPTIGYFDEEKSVANTASGGLPSGLEKRDRSTSKSTARGRKAPKLTKSEDTGSAKQGGKIQHPPNSRVQPGHGLPDGKLKSSSGVGTASLSFPSISIASNVHTINNAGIEGDIIFRSRKIGAGKQERRKIDQCTILPRGEERGRLEKRSTVNPDKHSKRQKAKGRINCATENEKESKENEKGDSSLIDSQVNELSKILEVIHLDKNMVIDNVPRMLSGHSPISSAEAMFSTRTPLGDKTSVCNRAAASGLLKDPTGDK